MNVIFYFEYRVFTFSGLSWVADTMVSNGTPSLTKFCAIEKALWASPRASALAVIPVSFNTSSSVGLFLLFIFIASFRLNVFASAMASKYAAICVSFFCRNITSLICSTSSQLSLSLRLFSHKLSSVDNRRLSIICIGIISPLTVYYQNN